MNPFKKLEELNRRLLSLGRGQEAMRAEVAKEIKRLQLIINSNPGLNIIG